jgi:hypothetical protein
MYTKDITTPAIIKGAAIQAIIDAVASYFESLNV